MYKLILADIKVLGHRIWTIPLGTFILVLIISLIPNVNMPDPVRYFMIALLSPCLLIFELLNQDQKRNSDKMIMTLPMSKKTYVISKYLTVIILSLTAIPTGWLSNVFHMLIQNKVFSLTESVSFLPGMLEAMGPILLFVYFILPIYYYTKKLKTSIVIGLLILWPVGYEFMSMIYDYFYCTYFSGDIKDFIYSFLIIVLISAILHFIVKFFFKSVPNKWIRVGWFAVMTLLSIISFDILTQNLEYTYVYTGVLQKLETSSGEIRDRYLTIISDFKYYIFILSLSLVLCVTTLVVMMKKSREKLQMTSVIYLFSPIILLILISKIYSLLKPLFHEQGSYDISMLIGLIVYFFYSAKSSIYLLKNNRTLKC
ncbi:MAG: ABC-2 transporter permease [Candidatus Delongbacteria bacterium]|jgi:hypothetical protein|nr:ABC-2 transporter permease [Candidatus Delongbacteria bacterium]